MPNNLPVRYAPLLLDGVKRREKRAVARQVASMQKGALLTRTHDQTRRDLTLSRMSDIAVATHQALEDGEIIANDLAVRIERNPIAAGALSGIAEDGILGLRAELRRLMEGR